MIRLDALDLGQDGFELRADLTLPGGSVVAVIGPSGAGKSTLLAAIAGFHVPRAGRILWQGQDLTALPPHRRPVSILFQDANLFPHLTLAQNIGLALRPSLHLTGPEAARVDVLLAQVGLADLGQRRPGAVSGGQAARAALARVLIADRPLVLLDEPFAALGPALRSEIRDLAVQRLTAAGRTVLMVTHDPAEARATAPLSLLVAEGDITGPHVTGALLDAPPPALAAYLGQGDTRRGGMI